MSYTKKRIVFYSQHLIGVGHHFRNLQIVRALAQNHEVHFVDGGRNIQGIEMPKSVHVIQLEPIFLNASRNLVSANSGRSLASVFEERRNLLRETLINLRPDVFIIEYFPFDRWILRSELLPAIQVVRSCGAQVVCSLRDIPKRVETNTLSEPNPSVRGLGWPNIFSGLSVSNKKDRQKRHASRAYYERVIPTLNRYFDHLLIHGDPQLTRLEDHFPWVDDIAIPLMYTGYVSEKLACGEESQKEIESRIGRSQKFVLVSAGGGIEAFELMMPCIRAWEILVKRGLTEGRQMIIFSGPFISDNQYKKLEQMCSGGPFSLNRFTSQFLRWMNAADFSISRAGYNTCMNILETGTPSLLFPILESGDQDFRAQCLANMGLAEVLAPKFITPKRIAKAIQRGLTRSRVEHNISLDGAERTNAFVSSL